MDSQARIADCEAKITQLAQLVERMAQTSHGYFVRAEAAEAELRRITELWLLSESAMRGIDTEGDVCLN